MFKKVSQHKFKASIIVLIFIGGGIWSYKSLRGANKETQYVLAAVEKGTLATSVSGSGQVSASDQIDIKSKVAGNVVYVGVSKDQEVKAGALLAQIDTRDAERTVTDAKIALESAKIKLEELLSPPDAAQSLLQAKNALAQAERDVEKAQDAYDNIETDTERALADAYKNGYSEVSISFFKLSDYMKDLQDVSGAERDQEYLDAYKIILTGADTTFVEKFADDYSQAKNLYDKSLTFFRNVFQDDDRATVYQLINDTLETAQAISRSLESARHMYDEIVIRDYKRLNVASYVDKMQPKIESDVSSIFAITEALQKTVDTIDTTVKETPDKIRDAKLALDSAQEKLAEKKQALTELEAGADSLDVRTQQNTVAQKEAALAEAQEKLADHYIRAPFDGVIAQIDVKKGDTVSSETLATLITKQRMAEIALNEIEIAKIKVGQKATLTVDAIDGLALTGKVAEIETVGTVTQGVVNYNVKITFDTQEEQIKPGMSVTVAIITNIKQDVLLVPNSAVKSLNNIHYVEISEDTSAVSNSSNQLLASAVNSTGIVSAILPKQQAVEIGLANDSITEITSGLKEGDKVVIRTISPSTTTQNQSAQGQNLFQTSAARGNSGSNSFRMMGR